MQFWITQIVLFLILIILFPLAISGFSFAPWVPTRKKDLKRIHTLVKLKKNETFYELGCGDARVCSYIAKKNPQAKVVGIELAYSLYFLAKIRQWIWKRKNLKLFMKNLFTTDVSKADVVYLFGIPRTLEHKIKQKLQKELKKNARIVSYVFKIPGWDPILQDKPSKKDASIYVYKKS